MTEPPAAGAAGAMTWTPVIDNQLVALAPDTTVIYSHDTLKALSKRNAMAVSDAFYFDNGADGYIDIIFVTADGAVTPERVREIDDSSLIGFPDQRKFGIRNCIPLDSTGFVITVHSDSAAYPPVTNIMEYDKMTVCSHRFTMGGRLFAGDIGIHDRVAPVIVSADIYEDAGDSEKTA